MVDEIQKTWLGPDYVSSITPVWCLGQMMLSSSHAMGRMFLATASQQQLSDQLAMTAAAKCMTEILGESSAEQERILREFARIEGE